jgi:hypothetical protein
MVKSRMQTDGFTTATGRKYSTSIDCVRQVWKAEGISAFTRGLGPTLIRFVPSSLSVYFNDDSSFASSADLHLLMGQRSLVSKWLIAS